jgi:hypothetical protein
MIDYTERLKKYWKTESLSFIATFTRFKTVEGFFNDFINPVSLKKLFYPEFDGITVENKKVSFYVAAAQKLKDGNFYKVDLVVSKDASKKNNPYSLTITRTTLLSKDKVTAHLSGSIDEELLKNQFQIKSIIEKDAAKEHIRLRFERLNNPEANKIIANLMREIGKGMYSSKQRMIFELLQNADDSPGRDKVEFHIDTNGDYFFVMHDGAPFSKDDVDAITSAAESTKRKDKKKTGYKGIGFKSVFTDSEEVWLKSAGYQFAFIRNSELFQDFESFYFNSADYRDFPELVERHRAKYQKDIQSYNSLTDIPWQVIPIWQDHLPVEFNDSNFSDFDNPVQFALKVGSSNIYSEDGYLNAVENIVKKPQFLLFLRNTSKFRSPKNRVTVTRFDDGQKIIIEKTKVEYIDSKGVQHSSSKEYLKETYSDILVNNEAFLEFKIGLKKVVEKNDLNEDTYYFVDNDGNKIETIPPKLALATETEVAFGIPILEGKISPEIEYLNGIPKYSSLFTYLPMEDTRFQLPFLINADFVPSSDRQRIQGDNLWNKYIIIQIARKHVETLASFALKYLNDPFTYQTYLSILLKQPLPQDDTAQHIIESYNFAYLENLSNTKLIVNDKSEIQYLSETIVDSSGLVQLFGHQLFYKVVSTPKRLPHPNLEIKFLHDYTYLEVQSIDLEELAISITPELCELIGIQIANQELYKLQELLEWLNKLVKHIPIIFGKIPFIEHNNSLFSIERLIEESDAWLINDHTKKYEKLISDLGFHTVNLNLDKFTNIKEYLHSIGGYLNDKTLAYERIASKAGLSQLEVKTKLSLVDFFENSNFMLGIGEGRYFGQLPLFIDQSGTARPLKLLLDRESPLNISSLEKFRIDPHEFENLTPNLRKVLIPKAEIFTSFILNIDLFNEWSGNFNSSNIDEYVSDVKLIFSWVADPESISGSDWASIPWIYVNDDEGFEAAERIYWSNAFSAMGLNEYKAIRSIIHKAKLMVLPSKSCGELIKEFDLKTNDNQGVDWSQIRNTDLLTTDTFLDWMEADGSFGNFFHEFTIYPNGGSNFDIEEIKNVSVYNSANSDLDIYIQNSSELSSEFIHLDKRLCSENRDKIGLLQGDKLLKAIIKSGHFDQALANQLPSNPPFELIQDFINHLPEFSLKTEVEYDNNSPEHFLLNSLIREVDKTSEISPEISESIETLRSKLFINGTPLSHYNKSDRVSFGRNEEKKILRLSLVLKEFRGDSDELEQVKEAFIHITQKEKLSKLIFRTRQLSYDEIHHKIEEEISPYYSVPQVIFQIIDRIHGGNRQWKKNHFGEYLQENGDSVQLQNAYLDFFDQIYELKLSNLDGFDFLDFDLNKSVYKGYAIDSELIPSWLNDWAAQEETKRYDFLSSLGYHGHDSAFVNMRKAMLADPYVEDTVVRYFEECKSNMQLVWNTVVWLSKYNSEIITQNIGVITRINNFIKFQQNSLEVITIPVILSIDKDRIREYALKSIDLSQELQHLSQNSIFASAIFSAIKNDSHEVIDESIGEIGSYFSLNEIEIEEHLDIDHLKSHSKLWNEAFYKKWEFANQYPIFIYDGQEIPFFRQYNNKRINSFTKDLKVCHDGDFFISRLLKSDVLNALSDIFPQEKLEHLRNWHYQTLQNESLLDEDSFEYKEDIDRLLQDRLGISEEDQKNESGNAKTHAIYFLNSEGYDISNVVNHGPLLSDIISPSGKKVDCIVRSAKGGLLYLDKHHWDMLSDPATLLVVIYPGNSPRLFIDRLDLLQEDLAENVLFRVPNSGETEEVDGVFKALNSESHLILVTSEKMRESLFSKIKKQGSFKKEDDSAIAGDDFMIEDDKD